ncbi:MAG: histidinol-phosphatase, partial [Lachnospiraceae bacterium]|nr:histidinol-phosphatase [Lachnospiraceae bacterium]
MMKANYHTHTPRCHHAVGSEREYIEAAVKQGFKILGFLDHTPQPYPSDYTSHIRMGMNELADYTETLAELREEYKDRIRIYIGYEVEYFPKYFDTLIKELKKFPLDYIIQGQHHVPDEITGFYTGFKTDSTDDLKAYVDLTVEGMKTGLFTYLAHPDLINFT